MRICTGLFFSFLTTSSAIAQVTPPTVNHSLAPGQSVQVNKRVTTPPIPPNPDLAILADTTGSMFSAIANVKANATAVMNTVQLAQPTAQFAVTEYRDIFDGPNFPFRINQNFTANVGTAQAAIDKARGSSR